MFSFEPEAAPTKLNIALWGPSGAGKTYTGMALAHQLGSRVAILDTEHRASSLYTSRFPAHIAEMQPPFEPERFIDAVRAAEAGGFDVLMFDSLSPEWDGPGGCLATVRDLRQQGKKPHQAWSVVTPRHDALLGLINRTRLSIVVTLREKPHLDLSGASTTMAAPTPVMRDRFEYEYDLVLHLDDGHRVTVTKSRLFHVPEGKRMAADGALLDRVRAALYAPSEMPS